MPTSGSLVASRHAIVRAALEEDRAFHDVTAAAVVPEAARGQVRLIAKARGVLAGCSWAEAAFRILDSEVDLVWQKDDGQAVEPGETVMRGTGSARALLAAERTALNFLQQLSGVATLTAQAVRATDGRFAVLDTRKTVPGLRDAQKAAVVAGGGVNHRRDLEDELLLKENHFAFSGCDYRETVRKAVAHARGKTVGVEAETREQALQALAEGATYVMLDNFPDQQMAAEVKAIRAEFPEAVLEVSGGLTPERIACLVEAGIDRVSLGALTHSAPALDLSLLFDGPLS